MIGTNLGPYQLRDVIGKGGMATVYRAYQPAIDRDVAVKVIHAAILHDTGAIDRFRREARLIARLEHPHILPIYDFDGAHDPPYIVMRYLDSGTLRDLLARQRLPLPIVGELLAQIAAALDYAHAQGVVHRDIKPSNILLDRHGNAFVSDFGIARIVAGQPNGEEPITQTGAIIGTPDYMAPEQAVARAGVDGRADVYALGVMLFQLLTGHLPYGADQPLATLLQHIQAPIPSARALNAQLPASVDGFFNRALAKEPAERFPTAGALAAEFATFFRSHTAAGAVTQDLRALTSMLGPRAAAPTPTPSEQHKVVTVLYADAAEYAELAEAQRGPEAARRDLRTLWERMIQDVVERGGSVVVRNEHDMLALWGADAASEDDAERAVRAALDMQAALHALVAQAIEDDEPLPLKIGINTGMALIAPGASAGAYTASGTTISLAQRLAAYAIGSIVIGHDTYREVRGVFDMEPDAPLPIRGKSGGRRQNTSLPTYRVIAPKARAFRIAARGVEGVETRMIGREAELVQLQSAWLDVIEDSETRMITVIGEAGIGKSRLLDEFDRWADLRPERYWIFPGRATAAMTRRPYALLRDVLSFRFTILDNDPIVAVRAKLEAGVAGALGAADDEMAHLIGHLAGFDLSDSPHIQGLLGDTAQLTARARQLLGRLFAQMGGQSPIVLVLEDLHYADDASLNLLNELVAAAPNLPLLLIGLARPALLDRRPNWGSGQPFHRRIVLAPLDKRSSRDLARELLQNVEEIPKALRDLLVERAEGNPLYMEELVKMLIEDRVILKESAGAWRVEELRLTGLRVPPTLRGLLQARFDTLLMPEKLTLQRAAVVGRVFFDGALLALDAADESHISDLPRVLTILTAQGFVERRETSSFAGSVEYSFAQAMLRDLIYDSLLSRQRQTYHHAMAGWLASSERAAEYLPLIAEHYEQAGDAAG